MPLPRYRPAILDISARGLQSDLQAALTVAIVALPLSMAIAIASGVGPDRGLVTAVIGGFLVSAMGGSRMQIGGPAGAFIVLVASCVAAIGIDGLILATMMSGLFLAVLGLLKMGGYIRYIPYPVTVGFTAAIGLIILASQFKDLFGLQLAGAEPGPLLEKIPALWAARETAALAPFGLALATIGVILALQRYAPRLPSLLIGVVFATLAGLVLPVETVADRFGALPAGLPAPVLPAFTLDAMRAALPFAVAFTLLGAIESLLSAVVADQMAGTRMRPDDELIGQGIANIGSGLFGGFCVTGTIARTATNVRAGSTGPISGMLHAGMLLLFLLLAAPLAGAIPLAALAGLLTIVAWNMIELHAIRGLLRASRGEAMVLVVTFLTVVFRDVTEGIILGFALGGVVFIARMAAMTGAESARVPDLPDDVMMVQLRGPVFFGAVAQLESVLDKIKDHPRLMVLDLRQVPMIDSSGVRMIAEMAERMARRDTKLAVLGANAPVRLALRGIRLRHLSRLDPARFCE
ncbi:MAG: SulP family inorganic anion transporter [Paracoccus sp. (in: a-proteobacteria)]|nr:SulP family inorganic anion transporter [Paracoccus sp. (in: a-proteobacteria)]